MRSVNASNNNEPPLSLKLLIDEDSQAKPLVNLLRSAVTMSNGLLPFLLSHVF